MSKNQSVDERIVQMQFNNSEFESKIAQTLESLTKLRESTKMEDAGKGMENLAKGVKQVDINSLAAGIEALNQKFSVFGIMGQQVIRNLTDSIMNLGNTMVNALTSAPRAGWGTFETYTSSVKSILNSAKDMNGLPVTLDKVNQSLDTLNAYSDKTIYSFNDMTSNISKFTNAGVDLDSAVTAIQGVANVAAVSGANAQEAARAMYNFGQALGAGYVKLIDWKSIQNANMATVDFKTNLIQTAEEMGVLKKVGDKWVSSTLSGAKAEEKAFTATTNFDDSLQQQWMTAEVLTKTLAKYTDETTELGKKAYAAATEVTTFTQMLDVFKESQATAWSKTWRLIFGDYEQSKKLWTGILNELNSFTDKFNNWRNDLLKTWAELGGRDDLIEAFSNLWTAAKHFLDPIKDLIAGLFPKVTADRLAQFTRDFRAFSEKLASPFKEVQAQVKKVEDKVEDVTEATDNFKNLVEEIIAGKWGNGEERIRRLTEAGYAFENLQNGVNETLNCTKRYETVVTDAEAASGKLVNGLKKQEDTQKDYREEIKKSNEELFIHKGAVENLAYIFLGVSSAAKVVVKTVNLAVTSFKKLSGGVGPVAAVLNLVFDTFGNLARHLYNFNRPILMILDEAESLGGAVESLKAHFGLLFNIFSTGEDSVDGANDKFGESRKLLANLFGIIDTAKAKIVGFFESFSKLGDSDFLVDARIVLEQIGRYVGGALLTVLNALAGVINRLIDGAKQVKETLSQNTWVTKLADAYTNAKASITEFWDTMKGGATEANNGKLAVFLDGFAKGISKVSGVISGVGGKAFSWFLDRLGDLNKASKEFYDYLKSVGAVDKIKSMWDQLKNVLYDIPTIIDNFTKSIKNGKLPSLSDLSGNLSLFVQSLGESATGIRNYVGGVFTKMIEGLTGGIANLASLQLPDKVKEFAEKIAAAFGLVDETTSNARKTIGDLIKNVIEKLKGIDLKSLAITGLIGSIALFVARWSKVGKASSNALKALTTFLKNGGKAAVDAKEKFNGFLKIAAALLLVAAALWVIGQIPADRFKATVATLAGAFAAMFLAVELLTHQKIDNDKLKGVGIAFAGIGAGVLLIAAAVKAFSQIMEDDGFAKGCAAVVVAIVAMAVVIRKIGPVSDGLGLAFVGLAASVLILAVAVKAFASMKTQTLFKGGAAVTYFVLVMAAAMKIAGDVKAEGFVGLAAAVLLLMMAVKSLGGMKTGKLVKGEIAVIALIAALAIASRSAKGVDGKAFQAMGSAIKALAAAMLIMSFIPTGKLIVITAALVAIFLSLKEAVKELKDIKPKDSVAIALALVALLAPIGVALYSLASMEDPNSVLKVAVGIAAVIWAIGEAAPGIAALSKIKFTDGIQAIALADAFFASVALLIAGIGWLSDADIGFGEALVNGASVIGKAVHAFLEAFLFGEADPTEVITSIGNALSGFGEKIGSFIDTLTSLDPNIGTNAKNLAMAILAICGAEVLEALAGWIGGKSNIDSFGQAISGVTSAIMDINEALNKDGMEFKNQQVKQVISCVKGLVEIAQELPKQGGVLQQFLGAQDLGDFARQMADFLNNGFVYFLGAVTFLGDAINPTFVTRVLMIKTATKALVDLANDLPASTSSFSFAQLFTGKQDLGNFATQMADFMRNGFADFARQVSLLPTFDPSRITKEVVPATEGMIKLGNKLKENSSLLSYFTDKSDLSIFGSTLSAFGKGLLEFSLYTENVKPANIIAISDSIDKLVELNASDKVLSNGLVLFSNGLINLGAGIKSFFADTSEITTDYISQFIDKLCELHNFMLIAAATDYSGVSGFVDALSDVIAKAELMARLMAETLFDTLILKYEDIYEVGIETASKWCEGLVANQTNTIAGGAMVLQMLNGIGQMSRHVVESGTATAVSWCDAFSEYIGNVTAGIKFMDKVLKGVTSKYTDFYNDGGTAALKFCSGLTEKYSGMLNGAGVSLGKKALDGLREKIGDFETEGNNAAEGFAKGIRDKASDAATEAYNMVKDAIDAAKEAQQSASPSKVFRKLGNYGGEGYGLGWVDMFSYIKNCVTGAVDTGLYAMRDAIEKTNSLIDEGFDDIQPTITPVLDLTQLANGMRTTRGLLAELNRTKTDVDAALSISTAHNEALEQRRIRASRDYSGALDKLLEATKDLNNTARKNRVAVIDGDYLFGYVNTRLGMA